MNVPAPFDRDFDCERLIADLQRLADRLFLEDMDEAALLASDAIECLKVASAYVGGRVH